MRMFWTIFFVGSMLLVGADVMERRDGMERRGMDRLTAPLQPIAGDPAGAPTPRPGG